MQISSNENGLFRPEAAKAAEDRDFGDVQVSMSPIFRRVSYLAVGLTTVLSICVFGATYSQKVTVSGWILPEGGIAKVAARSSGQVQKLYVSTDSTVHAGDPVALIKANADTGSSRPYEALLASFADEASAAGAKALVAERAADAQIQQLGVQRGQLLEQIGIYKSRIDNQALRIEIAKRDLERALSMQESGYVSKRDIDNRKNAILIAEDNMMSIKLDEVRAKGELSDLDQKVFSIRSEMEQARATSSSEIAGIRQRRIQTEMQSAYTLSAPIDGVVASLPLTVGQSVADGQVVANIYAADANLVLEMYVPSKAAGFISPGQTVNVMYQPFPFQKFGVGKAVVTHVGKVAVPPGEVALPGLETNEPVFVLRAKADRQSILAYGKSQPLKPGMLLTAEIVTSRGNLLDWIMDPVQSARGRH